MREPEPTLPPEVNLTSPLPSGSHADRLDFAQLRDDRLRSLYDYWQEVRGDREMPAPRDLKPEGMRGALGFVNLIDVSGDPPVFRFRLVGTEIVTAYGRDMTGETVDAVQPPGYRDLMIEQFRTVIAERRPLLHALDFTLDWRRHWLIRLSLPLGEPGERVSRIVTVSAFDPNMDKLDVQAFYEQLGDAD